jgi:hypothetical protein
MQQLSLWDAGQPVIQHQRHTLKHQRATFNQEEIKALYQQVKDTCEQLAVAKKWDTSLYWYGPGTGWRSGDITPTEFKHRIELCYASGDAKRIEAAIIALHCTLNRLENKANSTRSKR